MAVMKSRCPSAKVTPENRTLVALNVTELALESFPKYFSRSYVQSWSKPFLCVERKKWTSAPGMSTSHCSAVSISFCLATARIFESFLHGQMSFWFLWVRRKPQKSRRNKEPQHLLFSKTEHYEIPEATLHPQSHLDPNLPLPTRHPEKASCQPPSRTSETGFQRCLETWMPWRSWPWPLSRLNLACCVGDQPLVCAQSQGFCF